MKRTLIFILIIPAAIAGCTLGAGTPAPAVTPPVQATALPAATALPPTPTPLPTWTPPQGQVLLDFAAQLCKAGWANSGQHLTPCPEADADQSGGYAVILDPATEGLPSGTPVLLTLPATNRYSGLFLRYPPITLQAGDRFQATLRCQSKAPCAVDYALEYFDAQGRYSGPFLSWKVRHGDPDRVVDADLSPLAGQTVEFVLTLRPLYEAPVLDRSLWIAPAIIRPAP